jgi:chemotaxis protein methyltransferase CheR
VPSHELEAIEVDLLLDGVQRHHGVDLRGYCRPVLLQRLRRLLAAEGLPSVSALQASALHDAAALERLLRAATGPGPGLLDDPEFLLAFRKRVVPALRTFPTVRIWVAACGDGALAFSLAMVLEEEGLLPRAKIYATDGSEGALEAARRAELACDPSLEDRWRRAGGQGAVQRYFASPALAPHIRGAVFFAQHSLATDGAFNEFNAVLCRDVLLSFDRSLHNRVHGRLHESLARFGVLGLGRKESLARTPNAGDYEELDGAARLYRRLS